MTKEVCPNCNSSDPQFMMFAGTVPNGWRCPDPFHGTGYVQPQEADGPIKNGWDFPADLLEAAWGLIANASGGDWDKADPQWRKAAEVWRDAYQEALPTNPGLEVDKGDAAKEVKVRNYAYSCPNKVHEWVETDTEIYCKHCAQPNVEADSELEAIKQAIDYNYLYWKLGDGARDVLEAVAQHSRQQVLAELAAAVRAGKLEPSYATRRIAELKGEQK